MQGTLKQCRINVSGTCISATCTWLSLRRSITCQNQNNMTWDAVTGYVNCRCLVILLCFLLFITTSRSNSTLCKKVKQIIRSIQQI